MTPHQMESNIVRYGNLRPCKAAFIDAHTPGSDKKENFAIIGGGVAESTDQHVHIKATPGFNIGAAGQPPKCLNSLHAHRTAEVFFVLKGRWRFFWGCWGDAGEVVLEEGDIFNIPTGVFRGFENVGTDYGMMMSILGGNDAGGGVIWAPQVIKAARDYGLILGENGSLYEQPLPDGVSPMPMLTEEELQAFPEPNTRQIVPNYVARYWDLMAMADGQPVKVIGEHAVLRDKPGFEVELLRRGSIPDAAYSLPTHQVLMPMRGHWKLTWKDGETVLNPGDVCILPPEFIHSLCPAVSGESSLYRVVPTNDPAGPTWQPE